MTAYGQSEYASRTALLSSRDVRVMTQGILKNMDTGLLTKETLQKKAEELLVSADDYWMAYGLAALICWLADDRVKAQQALQRALQADDQKTSLFFFLLSLWEERDHAADVWLARYLGQQDGSSLAEHFQYCMEAYTDGLMNMSGSRHVEGRLNDWKSEQCQDARLIQQQIQTWHDWFDKERSSVTLNEDEQFKLLKKAPKASVEELLQGAHLPGKALDDLQKLMDDDEASVAKEQAKSVLLERFIEADRSEEEQSSVYKPYISWLTDWCLDDGEKAVISLRQYAIASSKDWIRSAADDAQGETIQKLPDSFEFFSNLSYEGHVDKLTFYSIDGRNERDHLSALHTIIDAWQKEELSKHRPGWTVVAMLFCIIGGGALLYYGGGWVLDNHPFMLLAGVALLCMAFAGPIGGLIVTAILAGITAFLMNAITAAYASHQYIFITACVLILAGLSFKVYYATFGIRRKLEKQFKQYAWEEENCICRCMAETADFYDYYTKGMERQQDLHAFLDGLSASDYVRRNQGSARRIRI